MEQILAVLAAASAYSYNAITKAVQYFIPGADDYTVLFSVYIVTTLVLFALLLSQWLFRGFGQSDVDEAYRDGVADAESKMFINPHYLAQEDKISTLQDDIVAFRREDARLKELVKKLSDDSRELDEVRAELALEKGKDVSDTVRDLRILVELARDLEGFEEVAAKAQRIIDAL